MNGRAFVPLRLTMNVIVSASGLTNDTVSGVWTFRGVVVSDWDGFSSLEVERIVEDKTDALLNVEIVLESRVLKIRVFGNNRDDILWLGFVSMRTSTP